MRTEANAGPQVRVSFDLLIKNQVSLQGWTFVELMLLLSTEYAKRKCGYKCKPEGCLHRACRALRDVVGTNEGSMSSISWNDLQRAARSFSGYTLAALVHDLAVTHGVRSCQPCNGDCSHEAARTLATLMGSRSSPGAI